jgi:hypothetical protein
MLDQTLGEALGESLGEALGEALGLGVVETRSGERPGSRSQNLGTATTAKIKGKGRAAKRTDSLTPSFIHSLTHSSFRVPIITLPQANNKYLCDHDDNRK